MKIIDENGMLFGVINLVDALIVLFVLSVGIGGLSIVISDSESFYDGDLVFEGELSKDSFNYVNNNDLDVENGNIINIDFISFNETSEKVIFNIHISTEISVKSSNVNKYFWYGDRLLIGGKYDLDLGTVIIHDAVLKSIEVNNE